QNVSRSRHHRDQTPGHRPCSSDFHRHSYLRLSSRWESFFINRYCRLSAACVARPTPAQVPQQAQPVPLAQPAPAPVAQPAAAPLSPPPATAQAQVTSAPQPLQQEAGSTRTLFRGVTDTEIRFGISAALSGPTKELGQNMKMGIMAAFNAANANGGVHGRELRLIAADDGYEPARSAIAMKQLYENDKVFGVVGNVGTPTAAVA